jgi:hypothetical protein
MLLRREYMRLFRNKRGQSATEYMLVLGLMVALIFIVYRVMKEKFPGIVTKAISSVEEGIGTVSKQGQE